MFNKKIQMYMSDSEQSILLAALVDMKNSLHEQGRYTDCVDEILLKIIQPKKRKVKIAQLPTTVSHAATEKSLSDKTWSSSMTAILKSKYGGGYNENGMCTGYPVKFKAKPLVQKYDDPYKQAEYAYSLIESEV